MRCAVRLSGAERCCGANAICKAFVDDDDVASSEESNALATQTA